jgi:hypothetical protein
MMENAVLLWVVGALAGSMVFFGAVVAPLVFRVLPAEAAGAFLRAFFPNYYVWGFVVAVLAAASAAFADRLSLALCLVVAILFLLARQWLMPKINKARDAALSGDTTAQGRFDRLHRFSVVINALQLILLLAIAARQAW